MKDFSNRVAAITGAASGIGRALAGAMAGQGAHLALSDIDDAGLAESVARCEGLGVKVTSTHLDVADRDAVSTWADGVVAEHGRVNLIVNNAGVALGATVESMSYEDFEWLMNINFWGVVYGTKAFLPYLKLSGEGHIVNISSVFGLISVPSQSAYNAAKFAYGDSPTRCAWSSRSKAPTSRSRPSTREASRRTLRATTAWTRASLTWPAIPTRPARTSSAPSSPAPRRLRTRYSPPCDATAGAP